MHRRDAAAGTDVFSHSFPAVRTVLFTHDRQYMWEDTCTIYVVYIVTPFDASLGKSARDARSRALMTYPYSTGIFVNVNRDCSASILQSCRDTRGVQINDVML